MDESYANLIHHPVMHAHWSRSAWALLCTLP